MEFESSAKQLLPPEDWHMDFAVDFPAAVRLMLCEKSVKLENGRHPVQDGVSWLRVLPKAGRCGSGSKQRKQRESLARLRTTSLVVASLCSDRPCGFRNSDHRRAANSLLLQDRSTVTTRSEEAFDGFRTSRQAEKTAEPLARTRTSSTTIIDEGKTQERNRDVFLCFGCERKKQGEASPGRGARAQGAATNQLPRPEC